MVHTDLFCTILYYFKGRKDKCKGFRMRWHFYNDVLWVHYLTRSEAFFFVSHSDLYISLCNFLKVGQFSMKKYICLPAVSNCSCYVWYPYIYLQPHQNLAEFLTAVLPVVIIYFFCSFNRTSWEKLFPSIFNLLSFNCTEQSFLGFWNLKNISSLYFPFSLFFLLLSLSYSCCSRPAHTNFPPSRGLPLRRNPSLHFRRAMMKVKIIES